MYSAVHLGSDLKPSNGVTLATAVEAQDLMHLWVPGRVVICWSPEHQPIRRWSATAKASARRKRLRARLERKAPLFADQLEQAALAHDPDYFAGTTNTRRQP